ncbi:MAG: hypothetical protein ACI848_001288, partial [Roseivirga sp.]
RFKGCAKYFIVVIRKIKLIFGLLFFFFFSIWHTPFNHCLH